jgi:hypothetical protein
MKKSELKELIKECIEELNEGINPSELEEPSDKVYNEFVKKLRVAKDYPGKFRNKIVGAMGYHVKTKTMYFESPDGEDYQMDMRSGEVKKETFSPGVYKRISDFS